MATNNQRILAWARILTGHDNRAITFTQPTTPEWENALSDVNRFIELYPGHHPEAYNLSAWIHHNLGNDEAAERDLRLAR